MSSQTSRVRGRDLVGVDVQEEVSNLDLFTHESTPSEWTDEKHSLYLKSMEASFVQQLYSSIESSGLHSHRKHHSHMRSRNQTESNSTGQRIEVGRSEPRPRQLEERQFVLDNPWIQRFKAKGREKKAVQENASREGQPMGGQGRTMYTCGFGSIKEHSNSQAYQDSNISREFSDQNFDDKDIGGGSGQVG